MSTPLKEERDDGRLPDAPPHDGPSKYAPKRPRMPRANPEKEFVAVKAAPPPEATEPLEPPWRRIGRPGAFVGDLDIVEVRHRLARSDRIPEPPLPDPSGPMWTAARRVTVALSVAAVIAAGIIGYRWGAVAPTSATPHPGAHGRAEIVDVAALESLPPVEVPRPPNRVDDRPIAPPGTTGVAYSSAAPSAPPAPVSAPAPPPAPASAAVTPPAPVPPAPSAKQAPSEPASASAPQPPDAAQIAVMVKRGTEFMANGNIGAARVMLRPAAEAGDASAAFALAETYDPFVLQRLGAKGGVTSNVAAARRWYEAARSLGSAAAPDRLVRLAGRSE